MDSDTIWRHTDALRLEFADLISTLTPHQCETPSLCPGWTVRDVGAHLASAHSRWGDVWRPLAKAGLNFDAAILHMAVDDPATPAEIAATLRGFAGSRRRPPIVSEMEPLVDIIVHTQDVCVPLGIERHPPVEACAAAADRMIVLNRNPLLRLRRPLKGVRLLATDTEWSSGSGPTVSGPIVALVMLLAGRDSVARPHLSGALERVPSH